MQPEQEKDTVERAKVSAEAFGELYDCHYSTIFNYVLRRTTDIDTAKDITASVFLTALRNIGKFTWRGVPFSHWLYRIAGNEVADHYRKKKREPFVLPNEFSDGRELPDEDSVGRNALEQFEEYLDLHAYISKLPVKYQEVIALRYFEDVRIDEIAGILRKPEGTVKSLLHRAVGQLREYMIPRESENHD